MNTTNYKYLIGNMHNRLPKNKKTKELYNWLCNDEHKLLSTESVLPFIESYKDKVNELNAKYPKTAELYIRWDEGKGLYPAYLEIRIKNNFDATLYIQLIRIIDEWSPLN